MATMTLTKLEADASAAARVPIELLAGGKIRWIADEPRQLQIDQAERRLAPESR